MVKLMHGPATTHIKKSYGGDTNVMKFYCTQNETTYGQKWAKFQPRRGRHSGAGYASNIRPVVQYSEPLDSIDNPTMGHMVSKNYESITHKHYKPYEMPNGTEILPFTCYQQPTGFVREVPGTLPKLPETVTQHVTGAPANFGPKHVPRLHTLKGKDPVEAENAGYGPGFMSTETQTKFRGEPNDSRLMPFNTIGPLTDSGWTDNQNPEPIQFHPGYAHKGDFPAYLTDRPTGYSITKTHYLPFEQARGDEPLPRIANCSIRDTGFTSGPSGISLAKNGYDKVGDMDPSQAARIRKNDPCEFMNATVPNNHTSVNTEFYQGKQRPTPTEADRLGRTKMGFTEDSGFTNNNLGFVGRSDDPCRFITHYDTRFNPDRHMYGIDREGNTWGGVLPQQPDGYTRSEGVHTGQLGQWPNTTATLRRLEPYQGRSVRARDVFFDDHTYDPKLHGMSSNMVLGTETAMNADGGQHTITTVF